MSVQCMSPLTPLLHSKTGVCRSIPIFLIFGAKHRLFVFATPVENILFTLLCTLHQPNSIDQCLFLAVVNFILAATRVRYF